MDTSTGYSASNAGDKAHGTVDRVAETAHQAVDRIAAKAAPAMDRMRDTAADATEALNARIDDLSAMQEELAATLREQVRAHPLAVVGIAVVAGMLLGRLSR
jgi:ElaB/YqjD/DUF883 family membrane-anchored ribosome-binding protein